MSSLILASVRAIEGEVNKIKDLLTKSPRLAKLPPPSFRSAKMPLSFRKGTAYAAGLDWNQVAELVLNWMRYAGGRTKMSELYKPVESRMNQLGWTLSANGRAGLRRLVNETLVYKGLVAAHDPLHSGWRITRAGQKFVR